MLGYRTLFSVGEDPDTVLDRSIWEFRRWLGTKPNRKYDGDALEFGTVTRYSADAAAVLLQESHPDGSRVVRAALTEVNSAGHWTTRLTAARSGTRPWIWLDVDGAAEQADGSGRRQWTSTPNLAKSLLAEFTAFDGIANLGVRPQRCFAEDVDRVIDMICDDTRRGLLFLAGTAPDMALQPWIDQVAEIVSDTAGLAASYVLDADATQLLNARMFGTHGVGPGTIRTYKPGADPASEWDARRHRILGRDRFANDSPRYLRKLLGWRAREAAIEQPLPRIAVRLDSRLESLTNSIFITQFASATEREAPISAQASPTVSTATLLEDADSAGVADPALAVVREAETITRLAAVLGQVLGRDVQPDEVEDELSRLASYATVAEQLLATRDILSGRLDTLADRAAQAEAERDTLRVQLEDEQTDHAQATVDLVRAETILDKLRVHLVTVGQGEAAWSLDAADPAPDVDSFGVLLRRVSELELVSFTGNGDITIDLDDYDPLGTWAGKAWRALLALSGYARSKATGQFDGGIDSYLKNTPVGRPGFSAQRHARDESEPVKASPVFRRARVFPVPTNISTAREVFMPAHFKIAQFGLISPRLHYHDATGVDGRIYVGYLGPHLPTKDTN